MNLTITPQDGYILVQTHGPIEAEAAEAFREQVHPLFRERDARVVVDLADSARINSRGIGNLVILVSDANTNGGKIVFAAPTAFVTNVFQVTRLNTYFDCAETVEEAVEKLLQSGSTDDDATGANA